MPPFKTAIDHDLYADDPHPGVAFLRLHPPGLDEPARLFPGLQVHTGKIDGVAERQLAGFRHASHQPVCGPQVTFVDAGDADSGDAVAVEYLLGPDEIGLAERTEERRVGK